MIGVPALISRGLDATFFVCSERLKRAAYLDTASLHEMISHGMRIGCHGGTHIPLRGLDDNRLKAETTDAQSRLSDLLGQEIASFAIPFGSYDRRVMRALAGFRVIYTSDFQASRPGARIIARHSYTRDWNVDSFTRVVAQLPTGVQAWLGRTKLAIKRMRP